MSIATKDKIADGLYELLKTHKIHDVTVFDIAEKCGVSKRTFYNHYSDKFDTVFYIFDRIEEAYFQKHEKSLIATLMLEDFEHNLYLFTHKAFFINTLCYTAQNNLKDYIISKWNGLIIDELQVEVTVELNIAINVFCYGLLSYMHGMLLGDIEMPSNLSTPLISLCIPQKLFEMIETLKIKNLDKQL